jgi:hypothetical protein
LPDRASPFTEPELPTDAHAREYMEHEDSKSWLAALSRQLGTLNQLLGHLILLIGIVTVFSAVYLMRAGYSVVPFWDELDEMELYVDWLHKSPLAWIWAQHNEHRILFYKLLFMVDMHFFRGRNWPMYVSIFCSQAALAFIVGYMLRKLGGLNGPLWKASAGIALYCAFCPSQWENLSWAFQLSFVLVNVWVAAAILSVLIQKQRLERGLPISLQALSVSLLMAAGATFTNGNGIVVWPVLMAIAWVASLPRWHIGIYFLGFACVLPLYLVGYHSPPNHASVLDSIRQPLSVLEYMEKYFGGAVLSSHIAWASQVGEAALIIAAVLIFRLIFRWGKRTLLDSALCGIVLYSIGTAFLTSLGRLNFGTDQAFASRYQTFALLFWFGLSIWILTVTSRQQAPKLLVMLFTLIAVVACSSAWHYRHILEVVKRRSVDRDVAGVALIVHVRDDNFLKTALLPFPISWSALEDLRAYRLSLFSTPMAAQFGADFTHYYKPGSPDLCTGSVDAISHVNTNPEDVNLIGWGVDQRTRKPLNNLVFVADARIVGFGISGYPRGDVVAALHSHAALYSGWIGYAKLPIAIETLDVYGILDSTAGEESCRLRTIQPIHLRSDLQPTLLKER